MKISAWVVFLALTATVCSAEGPVTPVEVPRDRCDSTETSYFAPDPARSKVHPRNTFTPEAKIVCYGGNQREEGQRDGAAYSLFYSDGSGSVTVPGGKWQLGCEVNGIDDSKTCYVFREALAVRYHGNGRWRVSRGDTENYPGTEIAIRLGEKTVIRAIEPGFNSGDSKRIVDSMKAGTRVRTRFSLWPSGISEADYQSDGFSVALDLMMWTFNSLKP